MTINILRQPSTIIFIAILLIGSFLRLYRLPQTLMFQGDQGRDAIIAKQIIIDGDLTLLGPVTSVGNLYLGPFYYYFMAPFLLLTYPSPVGPAYGVAIVSILTLILIWHTARIVIGNIAAFVASLLFALQAVIIEYSRFSWNPNIVPFFSLLIIYSLFKLHRSNDKRWLWLIMLSLAILAQLHYVALLMVPITAIMLLSIMRQKNDPKFNRSIILSIVISVSLVILPLLIFDLRNNFILTNSFKNFITSKELISQSSVDPLSLMNRLSLIQDRLFLLFANLVTGSSQAWSNYLFSYLPLGLFAFLGITNWRRHQDRWILTLFLVSTIISLIPLGILTVSVYEHYVLFFAPIATLFYAFIAQKIWNQSILTKTAITTAIILTCWLNLNRIPTILASSGPTPQRYQAIVEQIYPFITKDNYNVAAISHSQDFLAMPYRYFLEVTDKPPQHQDRIFDINQLIIFNETNDKSPLSHPAAIIAHPATYLSGIQQTIKLDGLKVHIVE